MVSQDHNEFTQISMILAKHLLNSIVLGFFQLIAMTPYPDKLDPIQESP